MSGYGTGKNINITHGYEGGNLSEMGSPIPEISDSDTASAFKSETYEPELVPFECSRLSGSLDFWDNPVEDIYTEEDGSPV